jgi:O-antigen ligase
LRTELIRFLSSDAGLAFVAVSVLVAMTLLTLAFRRDLGVPSAAPIVEPTGGPEPSRLSAASLWRLIQPELALPALLIAAALVVPLVFTIASHDVFVLPKLTALRVIAVVALLLLAMKAVRRPGPDPSAASTAHSISTVSLVDLGLAAYVGMTFLATWASVDPKVSLVGQFRQNLGLLTIIMFAAFYWLARASLGEERRLRLLSVAAVAGASVVSIYALAQELRLDPIWQVLDKRFPFSTLGQHEWLGAYLLFSLALGVPLLWQGRRRIRLLFAALLLLVLVALAVTQSRGSYVAALVALMVFVLVAARDIRVGRQWLAAAPVLAVAAMLVLVVPTVRAQAQDVAGRAMSIASPDDSSAAVRYDLWEVGLAIAVEHPLLGTGPDTYPEVFPPYRDRFLAERRDFWLQYRPESPHNVYLAIADGAGVPALALYLGLIGVIFFELARAARRMVDPAGRILLAGVMAAAAGHLVADFFMTAGIAGTWMFWLVLGGAIGYAETSRSSPAPEAAPGGRRVL